MSHPDTSGWPEPDDPRERRQAGTADNAPRRTGRHVAVDRDDAPDAYRADEPSRPPTGRHGRPGAPDNGAVPDRAPDNGAVPDRAPDNGAVPDRAPDNGAVRDGAPDSGAVHDGAPDSGAVRDGAPDSGAVHDGAPDSGAVHDGAPDNGAPDRGIPNVGAHRSGASDDGVVAPASDGTGSPAAKKSRAGRNLPAAIGVGVTLGAVVLVSLFVWRPAFLGVVTVAVGIGIWEMTRAVEQRGPRPPLLPLLAGAVVMESLAWYDGAEALILGLVLTVLAALVWRLADGPAGYQRDATATALVAVYVPFLAGYAVLLAKPDDGAWRVLVTLAAVVLSDTGGYVAGVFFGKHPMAPTVSPKKSWEGFAGSVLSTALGGALLFLLVMDLPWWQGVVFGAGVSAACVLGDLGESLIKRDLGVKDMSNLLPGHGGLMDRLDSILFAAPTAYLLLLAFSPV